MRAFTDIKLWLMLLFAREGTEMNLFIFVFMVVGPACVHEECSLVAVVGEIWSERGDIE